MAVTLGRVAVVHAALAALLAWQTWATADEGADIALLPFENVSGSISGSRIITPLVAQALVERGYRPLPQDRLERFLFAQRIRNTGMLSRSHAAALRRELGVERALVGSVALYNDSSVNPQWGLSARVLSTDGGTIVWAGNTGVTGGDFTKPLGIGAITSGEKLAGEAASLLLRDLPAAGSPLVVPRRRGVVTRLRAVFGFGSRPEFGRSRSGFRSPVLDSAPPKRVAVLPFENLSERKGAARILADLFTNALFHHGRFEVVEPGSVAEALLAAGVVAYGVIDAQSLAELRKHVGADAVVIGTVFNYNEGLKRGPTSSPEIELDARMLDAGSGKILWFASRSRRGEDSEIALELGRIRSMVPLATKVVREMVSTL